MKVNYSVLESKAQAINASRILVSEIHINRRNGYYAIDAYDRRTGEYRGYIEAGLDARECYLFLKGMQWVTWAF